jgi:prophage antirepressor-like protein
MSEQESTQSLLPLHYAGHLLHTHVDEQILTWWLAKEIAQPLGYRDAEHVTRLVDDDEKGTLIVGTPGGTQEMLALNESGLYHAIFASRREEAKAFRRWVTAEVLPSLRRTGTYTMPSPVRVKPSNHLPPPHRPVQEMAHVSEMLLAVWTTLRQTEDPMTNTEIAHTARVPLRTVQRHTKYLLQLGLIDLFETRPHHLFLVAEQADKRAAGYFQRLERIAAIMEQRQRRLFA